MSNIKVDPNSKIDSSALNKLLDETYATVTKAVEYNSYIRNRQRLLEYFLAGLNFIKMTTNAYGEKIPTGVTIKDSDGNLLCSKDYQPWTIFSPDTIWCVEVADYPAVEDMTVTTSSGPVSKANFRWVELLPVDPDMTFLFYDATGSSGDTASNITTAFLDNDTINFGGKINITNNSADYMGIRRCVVNYNSYQTGSDGHLLFRNTGYTSIDSLVTSGDCDSDQIQIELYESDDADLVLANIDSATQLYNSDTLGYSNSVTFSTPLSVSDTYVYTKVIYEHTSTTCNQP